MVLSRERFPLPLFESRGRFLLPLFEKLCNRLGWLGYHRTRCGVSGNISQPEENDTDGFNTDNRALKSYVKLMITALEMTRFSGHLREREREGERDISCLSCT